MIVWMASYPKSGNTWARLMISAYMYDVFDINQMDVGTSDTSEFPYQLVSPMPNPTPEIQMFLRHAALVHMLFLVKQRPLICKTHNANGFLGSVSLFPPELTKAAIYIVRDPRDIAVSFSEHMGLSLNQTIESMSNDLYGIGGSPGEQIVSKLMSWSSHVESWTEKTSKTLVLKYEDMLDDPEAALNEMLKTCGIQINVKRLKRAVEACHIDRLRKAEKQGGFVEAPGKADSFFKRGKSGGWKDTLTPEQAFVIESNHGDVMRRFGYLSEKSAVVGL